MKKLSEDRTKVVLDGGTMADSTSGTVAQTVEYEEMPDEGGPSCYTDSEDQRLAEKLSELAGNGVYLKNRDEVRAKAKRRGWLNLARKAESADWDEWDYLVAKALN